MKNCFDRLLRGGDKDQEKKFYCMEECSGSVILVVVKIAAAVVDVPFW